MDHQSRSEGSRDSASAFGGLSGLRGAISVLFTPISKSRLRADLAVLRRDLERRVGESENCEQIDQEWAREACRHAADAQDALNRFRTREGWAHLEAARRAMIGGFEISELRSTARSLLEEAKQKVKTWRGGVMESLLADVRQRLSHAERSSGEQAPDSPVSGEGQSHSCDEDLAAARAALKEAMWHRDEYLQNDYRTISLLRRRLAILMTYLVAAVALLLGLQRWLPLPLSRAPTAVGQRVWLYVMGWGILGGTVTAVLSVIARSPRPRVPEAIRSGVITAIRPLFGAAGALAAYVFLLSGALGIERPSVAGIFGVAFAAGFSETLIVRAMGRTSQDLSQQ